MVLIRSIVAWAVGIGIATIDLPWYVGTGIVAAGVQVILYLDLIAERLR
jgi:hypothetical protein